MNLYSYGYLTHSSTLISTIFIGFWIFLGLVMIITGIIYYRNRTKLRYRDVFFVALAGAILLIAVEVNNYQSIHSSQSQNSQTVQVMKDISHNHDVPLSHIYSNSPSFTNGMMIKAGHKFYTVNANNDNSAYHLSRMHPISHKMNYIKKNQYSFHFNPNTSQAWNIAIKFILGILAFVFQIDLMGKNNLAPSNPLDQLENYGLGGIIGGVIYNQAITIVTFIIIILIWFIVIFGIIILASIFPGIRNFAIGRSRVIINDGHIDVDTALRNSLSASDIIFKLRSVGVKNFQDVKRVILEKNGQLTVDKLHDKDVGYPLILDGHINDNALERMHHSHKWLLELLRQHHHQVKNVFLGELVDGQLQLTLYPSSQNRLTRFAPKRKINLSDMAHRVEQMLHHHHNHNHSNGHQG